MFTNKRRLERDLPGEADPTSIFIFSVIDLFSLGLVS
jgi:hypothetical protein